MAADKPAEREDKRVERPEEPRVEEPRVVEHRAAKPEVLAILGSGTPGDATRTTLQGRVSRDSLAIKAGSNSFSSRQ